MQSKGWRSIDGRATPLQIKLLDRKKDTSGHEINKGESDIFPIRKDLDSSKVTYRFLDKNRLLIQRLLELLYFTEHNMGLKDKKKKDETL